MSAETVTGYVANHHHVPSDVEVCIVSLDQLQAGKFTTVLAVFHPRESVCVNSPPEGRWIEATGTYTKASKGHPFYEGLSWATFIEFGTKDWVEATTYFLANGFRVLDRPALPYLARLDRAERKSLQKTIAAQSPDKSLSVNPSKSFSPQLSLRVGVTTILLRTDSA
jgi:hypothetical protein